MKDKAFIRQIRQELPRDFYRKTPSRLLWIPVFAGLMLLSVFLFRQNFWGNWVLGALLLGYAYAGMAFLFHDLRHGGIVENQRLIDILSHLLIWPCLVSPRFWDFWHNQLHHRHHLIENRLLKEYPTDSFLKRTPLHSFIRRVAPPEKGLVAFLYLFFWYVPFIVLVQILLLFQKDRFKQLRRSQVAGDMAVAIFLWAVWLSFIGWEHWFWSMVVAYGVQSYLLSSYVVTNHHPSLVGQPEEKILSTCSVTVPRPLRFLHLEFGLHTEHHLFPDISPVYLPRVQGLLKEKYGDRYCVFPKWKALWKIYFSK